jgi:NADH-quinone oxidoreductase subunit G
VGCNLTLNTRLETRTGGYEIKRVMPRQNEQVNEIWICDKGRFVHHFTRSQDRLTVPLVRDASGKLVESTWEAALQLVADRLRGKQVNGVIGDRIANEDAYVFGKVFRDVLQTGSVKPAQAVSATYADLVRAYGVGKDTDLKQLGKGDVVMVVNGDLEESAPVWFLRLRQAVVDRGARLIVAHDRSTKMHRYASQIVSYELGRSAQWAIEKANSLAEDLKSARNLVIVFGDEKLSSDGARSLVRSLANILISSGHAGKANSGLLPLYPHANTQGVFDMLGTVSTPPEKMDAAWLVGVGDGADANVLAAGFMVVQELFLTDLAQRADVVLPALSFAEREGTFTSGDRRVQRFYRALPPLGQARPDWWIIQEVAKRLGAAWNFLGASHVFLDLAQHNPYYAGLTYDTLSQVQEQWPPMGRGDLYYGGTVYDNSGGAGVRYSADAERAGFNASVEWLTPPEPTIEALRRLPRRLYQDGELIRRSNVLAAHIESGETELPRAAK